MLDGCMHVCEAADTGTAGRRLYYNKQVGLMPTVLLNKGIKQDHLAGIHSAAGRIPDKYRIVVYNSLAEPCMPCMQTKVKISSILHVQLPYNLLLLR